MTSYLFSQCFHGGYVDTATFCVVQQHPQNSELSTDGLSTASGSSDKHIVITVVHCIEHWRNTDNTVVTQDKWVPAQKTLIHLWDIRPNHIDELNVVWIKMLLYPVFEWG